MIIIPKKITHEEYLKIILNKHNSNILIKSIYNGTKNPIDAYCVICNHCWTTRADSLFKSGCPICGKKNRTKTHDDFIIECKRHNPTIEITSIYINSRTNVSCRCTICGYEWDTLPTNITSHHNGCSICSNVLKRTHEQFIEEMTLINPNISFRSEYCGVDNSIDCHCKLCKYNWTSRAGHLLKNTGCPNCRKSKGEEKISSFLSINNIPFEDQKRYPDLLGIGGRQLSYDFYLPSYNLLIEFQGKQHELVFDWFGGEERFKIQQEHDIRKREYAKLHNIELLEIWYYEFNNIEKILHEKINALQISNAS